MKPNEVQIDKLVKGKKYYFDDYSKDCGYFDQLIDKDTMISVKFVPIKNTKYAINNGKVGFLFNKNKLETFYKE